MKEEDSNPLEPVGDEPIEARIVAWVLGDASAFEAAELERLCAENPEWEVFRRRMISLHGLLAESGDTAPDDQWKLPPGKRAKVEALFQAPVATAPATLLKPKRKSQPWIRQALMATAACLVLAAGFRYVFEPAKEGHAALAANEKVAVMSARKPSDAFWAGRDLPLAEGYASNKPVLPEIADMEEERLTRSELMPDRPMGGGLKVGGGAWGSSSGGGLAANNEPEITTRSRSKAAPVAKAGAAGLDLSAQRGAIPQMPFGAPATPPPAPTITAAPTEPEAKPEIAAASGKRSNTDFDGQTLNGALPAGKADMAGIVTGGLRSGDAAIARNDIDTVLSNPDRSAGEKGAATAEGGLRSDLTRASDAAAPADLAKNESKAESFKDAKKSAADRSIAGLADGINGPAQPSSAPTLAEATKEPKGSKEQPQLGLAFADEEAQKAKEADTATPSNIQNGLRTRKSAAPDKDFSNLDDMGRLAMGDQEANAPAKQRQMVLAGQVYYQDGLEQSKELQDAPADPFSSLAAKDARFAPARPATRGEAEQLTVPQSQPAAASDTIAPAEPAAAASQTEYGLAAHGALNANSTSVEGFKRALQAQEDMVEEKRKLLTNIVRTKGIILTGQESLYRSDIDKDDHSATNARDTANKLEQEKIQLESQIQTLQTYNNDQLLSYASGLDLPENIVKTLYPEYLQQQRDVNKLKEEGLSDGHPKVVARKQALANMKRQLDEGTTNLKESLQAQLALADDRLAKFKTLSDEKQGEALERSIDSTAYLQAKNDLEGAQAKLKELKKQLAAAETATPAPPKPAPVPADETIAAAEPFSTFSLHVSDASFKLAKAALDRGERLSADQIRTEEFYNAFDYGDPAPAAGEPVACTIEQAAHPVLPQRNIVRVAMRVGSAGRGQGQPLNLTLLLDNSGSMEREDRHEGLKAAIAQLATLLQPGDTITLAGFSRTPHLLADRLSGAEAGKLVELVDKLPSEGGTNLEEALKLAGELAIQRKNPAAQNRIVLLTDGAANLGNAQPDDLAQKVAELRQQGIAFDAAGIGAGGLNDRMLEALTRHGNGRYYIVNDPKDADANFAKQLAGAFRPAAENVKVQVHFNPDRVSRYKLIGFEKHRLNTEDFHNDAVDAAELAADEAGVALYQVETRPNGSGEIGEVSVRFRDTTAGHMVENTWTIPHDEKTPAFDQARPSIQLATLSMLAAEKLRGGPLAEATDFTTLSPVISRVKNYYSTSSRVGELTDMTGKLR